MYKKKALWCIRHRTILCTNPKDVDDTYGDGPDERLGYNTFNYYRTIYSLPAVPRSEWQQARAAAVTQNT